LLKVPNVTAKIPGKLAQTGPANQKAAELHGK